MGHIPWAHPYYRLRTGWGYHSAGMCSFVNKEMKDPVGRVANVNPVVLRATKMKEEVT
ncbi:hypothetical protein [Ruminococcus sp. 5_1_39BFAA]|uniref:hypothetical protein n=1 Tax=Ruminococcus sp. 5_1_39BFAA TaxID=457412 RepID=UPI003562DCF0